MNQIIIIGHLGQDPQMSQTQSGLEVCKFSVATDDGYKGGDGNRVERTTWHRITVFGKLAVNCQRFITKGSKVCVVGSLLIDQYEKDGEKKSFAYIKASSVEFLDRKSDGQGQFNGGYQPQQQFQQQGQYQQQYQQPQQQQYQQSPRYQQQQLQNDNVPF